MLAIKDRYAMQKAEKAARKASDIMQVAPRPLASLIPRGSES